MRPRPGSLSARLLSRSLQRSAAFVGALMLAAPAFANHPVLVEGNCNVPPAGGPQGSCRADYDGDGSTGAVEDGDGDRVFGTLGAALAAAGANQNGRVVIVSSGTFAEGVRISGANGNVTLEAAPGVEANVDAVLQGDPGNIARQSGPGIVVDAPGTRIVTLRNLVSRNWTEGILLRGASRVVIDGCRLENNSNYGIHVVDQARATITGTTVSATGFRVGAAAPGQTNDFPVLNLPDPGVGIEFEGEASGVVAFSTVSSSFGTGILNDARHGRDVRACQVTAFDNARNYERVVGGGCRGDDD